MSKVKSIRDFRNNKLENVGRAKAIRKACLECMGGSFPEVRECTTKICWLWRYRMRYEVDWDNNKGRIKD